MMKFSCESMYVCTCTGVLYMPGEQCTLNYSNYCSNFNMCISAIEWFYIITCMCCFDCSVEIYGRMSTDLLPTPAKSHYVFNLRDLSKCVQGEIIYSVLYNNDHLAYTYMYVCVWRCSMQAVYVY